MKIRDILQHKGSSVVTIAPDRTVHEAIQTLCEHRIGALVVVEAERILGILTERDILTDCGILCDRLDVSLHRGEKSCPHLVRDIMTTDLVIGVPDDGIDYVMRVMTRNRVRHLPILENGRLAGLVSIGDVVHASLEEIEVENRFLKDYIQGAAQAI